MTITSGGEIAFDQLFGVIYFRQVIPVVIQLKQSRADVNLSCGIFNDQLKCGNIILKTIFIQSVTSFSF